MKIRKLRRKKFYNIGPRFLDPPEMLPGQIRDEPVEGPISGKQIASWLGVLQLFFSKALANLVKPEIL